MLLTSTRDKPKLNKHIKAFKTYIYIYKHKNKKKRKEKQRAKVRTLPQH